MAGLLSPQLARTAGLLGGLYADGRESAQSQVTPAPTPAQTPVAPPARRRPSLLETVWGMAAGYSPDAVADNYDQRMRAREARDREDAMRPTLLARQDQLRQIAQSMGPAAMVAFETNPQAFGESLGQQYRPQTVAEGSLLTIPGTGATLTNERRAVVGDRVVGLGTNSEAPRELLTVEPSFDNRTQRAKQEADAAYNQGRLEVERGQLGVAQTNAETSRITATRPQAVTTATGAVTNLISPTGSIQGTIEGRAAPNAAASNAAQAQAGIDSNLAMIGNTRAAISRARGQTGFWSAGTLTQGLPFNQSRANLEATLDTIRGNLSFTELAKMRAASPTGGALGSIAVRELDLLGSTVASLDTAQSQAELERSLDIIDASMKRYEDALREARRTGQLPAVGAGRTATNPTTGERIQWNGSAWVPM